MTDIERKAALLAMASNEESSEWTIDEAQRFMDGWLARARSERVVSVRELEALCAEWETQVRCAYYTEAKPLLEDLRALIAKAGVGDE